MSAGFELGRCDVCADKFGACANQCDRCDRMICSSCSILAGVEPLVILCVPCVDAESSRAKRFISDVVMPAIMLGTVVGLLFLLVLGVWRLLA